MKTPILSLKNVSFKVPSKATPILSELFLDIYPGDFLILLGSNGSGKSSLIKMINGLASPTSGSLTFQGKNISSLSLSARARSIVTLAQDPNLSTFSELTILENCLIALHRNKRFSFTLSVKNERKKVAEYLFRYHPKFCSLLDEPISSLSGGERQTLAFAMSLWNHPSLLLLDEHTSALDPLMAEKLMQQTNQIAIKKQITTLMTTHNLNDALRFGNRLIAMNQGKIILDVQGDAKERLTREDLLALY